MTPKPTARRHERGVAIILTSLILVPLMIFAAYAVDLAGWYARITDLQRAADAAALAGAPWMPDFSKASDEARLSLRSNGLQQGVDGINIVYARGSTATSFRVTVTDTSADRYFSQVVNPGNQRLSRFAEAEYNLPLPLGSPLNYFGGDASKTVPADPPDITHYQATNPTGLPPTNGDQSGESCNRGTNSGQALGSFTNGVFNATGYSTSWNQCYWQTVTLSASGGTTTSPPAGHLVLNAPNNSNTGGGRQGCQVRTGGGNGTYLGRFINGTWQTPVQTNAPAIDSTWPRCTWPGNVNSPPNGVGPAPLGNAPCQVRIGSGSGTFYGQYTDNAHTSWSLAAPSSATNPTLCTWTAPPINTTDPATVPADYNTRRPSNFACNVGEAASNYGSWNSSGNYQAAQDGTTTYCRWIANITSYVEVIPPPPNPIDANRSPGFWAQVHGPGADQQSGDAYSTRCTTSTNCGTPNNSLYIPSTDVNAGYWYVIKPTAGGSTVIRVFDAQLTPGNLGDLTGDSNISGTANFSTEYRVYRQTNPLDFTSRVPVTSGSANTTVNSCNWSIDGESSFRAAWVDLCTISMGPDEIYLLNVRSVDDNGAASTAGRNGYAVEACLTGSCTSTGQPAVYSYERMVMYNATAAGSNFYIAQVGEQYRGKTLVLELFDPGETTGQGWIYIKQPGSGPGTPNFVSAASGCEITSTRSGYPRPADLANGGNCSFRSADGSSLYNGHWVTIRVTIPETYECDETVDPTVAGGSCWWGIQYNLAGSTPTDTTTWRARIEGNPLQLTE